MQVNASVFSTQSISDPEIMLAIIQRARMLWDEPISLCIGTDAQWVKLSPENENRLIEEYSTGCLVMRLGEDVTIVISWINVEESESVNYINNLGLMPNRVSVYFPDSCLSDKSGRSQLIDLITQNFIEIDAFYGFIDTRSELYPATLKAFSGGLGMVHWVDIYGKPFLEILDEERMIKLPFYMTKSFAGNLLTVCTEDIVGFTEDPQQRAHFKELIGHQFYAVSPVVKGEGGVSNLFVYLAKSLFTKKEKPKEALVCPKIDYSNLYAKLPKGF